ncbi:YihY/virulence factor BrkB family protein [Derxia lacustris]|uniref:YihY/virulence factor BrkB family protein n=1 Tax=Derxia lacustris TaxID=764842 RepID=UPI000A16F770|nr:YihY/virulence factor BrkB family protein [Derxia lacustris]
MALPRPLRLAWQAALRWVDDQCSSRGAALAYYAAFSLAPILVIAVSVSGLVFGREAVEGRVLAQLQGLIGHDGASLVQRMIEQSYLSGGGVVAAAIGLGAMLIGATSLFAELDNAFAAIFGARRSYRNAALALVMGRLRGLAIVIGVGFLLIVSLVASAAVVAASEILTRWTGTYLGIAALLQAALSLAFLTALFGLMFKLLIPVRLHRRTLLGGAVLTALLFELGKFGVGLYLGRTAFGSTFGTAGSLAVLLFWVYYVALVVLYGAEVMLQLHASDDRPPAASAASA